MSRKHILAAAAFSVVGTLGASSAFAVPVFRVDIDSDNLAEASSPNAGYSQTEGDSNPAIDPTPAVPAFESWKIDGGLGTVADPDFGDPRFNNPLYTGPAATPSKVRVNLKANGTELVDSIRRFGMPGETTGYTYNNLYRDFAQGTHSDTSVYNSLTIGLDNNPGSTTGTALLPNTAYNVTFFVYDKFADPAGNGTVDASQGNTTMHFTDITSGGLGQQSDSYIYSRLGTKTDATALSSSPPTALDNYTWSTTITAFTDGNGALSFREITPDAVAGGIIRGTGAQGGNKTINALLNGLQIEDTVNSAVAGGGSWTSPATWANGIVPSNSTALVSQAANFFNDAGGTVTFATPTSVSYLNFAGTGSYTLAGGANQLILDSNRGPNASVSIAARAGSHTINAPVRVDNRLFATINTGATVTITGDITFGSNLYGSQITDVLGNQQPSMLFKSGNGLLVAANTSFSQVTLSAGTLRTTRGATKVNSLTFGMNAGVPTARLDLTGGAWAVDYTGTSPAAAIIALIDSGRAGAFTGPGITSSLAAGNTRYAIGYGEASALNNVTSVPGFSGVAIDNTTFLFRSTLRGDATLDGTVNFDDLIQLAQSYNQSGKTWIQGDSDYNGVVNFDDLIPLAQNYNSSVASGLLVLGDSSAFTADWALAQSLVPEPTTLAALGLLASAGVHRRRR